MNWIKRKVQAAIDWIREKSPPPVRTFAENNPKTFWAIVFILWAIPFGLTALFAFNMLVWLFYL